MGCRTAPADGAASVPTAGRNGAWQQVLREGLRPAIQVAGQGSARCRVVGLLRPIMRVRDVDLAPPSHKLHLGGSGPAITEQANLFHLVPRPQLEQSEGLYL